jgi:hypothetical protein
MKTNKVLESLKILLRRILDNPACLINYPRLAFYYLFGTDRFLPFYKKIKILSPRETLDYLIKTGCSFVRFGTGEAQISLGMGFYAGRSAQNAAPKLVKRMNDLFKQNKVLVGIGARFLRANDQELKKISKYTMFLRNRVYLRNKLKSEIVYGDAFAFRDNFNIEKLLAFFKTKNLIIISRDNPNIKKFAELLPLTFIEAPAVNAFKDYDRLLEKIKTSLKEKNIAKESALFLVALGPTAKPLVVDIDSFGFVAWDVGAFFEDFIFSNLPKKQ